MGFQHMIPVVHSAASKKGGEVRKRKGFATMDSDRLSEVSSLGGKARHDDNRRKTNRVPKDTESDYVPRLADILGNVNEDSNTRPDTEPKEQ